MPDILVEPYCPPDHFFIHVFRKPSEAMPTIPQEIMDAAVGEPAHYEYVKGCQYPIAPGVALASEVVECAAV